MNKITEFYNASLSYDDTYRYFCAHQTCKQFLSFYGITNPELYLNTVLDFTFTLSSEHLYGIHTSINYNPILPGIVENIYFFNEDYSKIIDMNIQQLDKGLPVIIGVDTYYLPYMDKYQNTHGAHAIFLCGMDYNEAYIIDWQPPYYYKGKIELSTIHDSRKSENAWNFNTNSGGTIQYSSLQLEPNYLYNKIIPIDSFISFSIENYYHSNDSNSGFYGLKCAIYQIINMFDFYSDDRTQFYRYLHTLFFPQYAKKVLFQKHLIKFQDHFDKIPLKKCLNELNDILLSWNEILNAFLRIAYTQRSVKEFINDLKNMLNSIIFSEANLVYALNTLIK